MTCNHHHENKIIDHMISPGKALAGASNCSMSSTPSLKSSQSSSSCMVTSNHSDMMFNLETSNFGNSVKLALHAFELFAKLTPALATCRSIQALYTQKIKPQVLLGRKPVFHRL